MIKHMISFVIPIYNESDNISFLLTSLRSFAQENIDINCEFVLVNDGSKDDSLDLILNMSQQFEDIAKIKVLSHSGNYGLSYAIKTGILAASFDWVCYIDGDLQVPIEEVLKLIPYMNQYDMISGLREKRNDKLSKQIISWMANGIRSYVLDDKTQDTGCPLKLMRRDFALRLPLEFEGFHRFIPYFFKLWGGKTNFVPVDHRHRLFGYSKFNLFNRSVKPIIDLIGMKWLSYRLIANTEVKVKYDA